MLLADLAKTQYIRDDEGPYSCINLDQHIMSYTVILMSFCNLHLMLLMKSVTQVKLLHVISNM